MLIKCKFKVTHDLNTVGVHSIRLSEAFYASDKDIILWGLILVHFSYRAKTIQFRRTRCHIHLLTFIFETNVYIYQQTVVSWFSTSHSGSESDSGNSYYLQETPVFVFTVFTDQHVTVEPSDSANMHIRYESCCSYHSPFRVRDSASGSYIYFYLKETPALPC